MPRDDETDKIYLSIKTITFSLKMANCFNTLLF